MNCDYCGKDDFKHVSELNRHKPQCPKRPGAEPELAVVVVTEEVEVEPTPEPQGEQPVIIPVEFLLKHLPMVVTILPRKCTLAWDVQGYLDDDLNLHVEAIKNHRRGR